MRKFLVIVVLIVQSIGCQLPPGFVSISDVDPTIILDIRYHTNHNFVGKNSN